MSRTISRRSISRITGVGAVDFHGQQKPAVRIQINPTVASAMGISLEDIRAAIGTATVDAPKGTLDGPKQSLTLDTTDQLFDAAAFESVIIAYRNGAPVRIRDVGKAINGVEDIRQAAWLGGQRAVIIDVHKQPGYNINADRRSSSRTHCRACNARCRPRSSCRFWATAPRRSAHRSATCSSPWR